jgi:hypothetical protein
VEEEEGESKGYLYRKKYGARRGGGRAATGLVSMRG